MMCAGLTTYSPLVRAGTGPGKKVAILGIGGLGHFGLLWSKALGAEVYALSHSPVRLKSYHAVASIWIEFFLFTALLSPMINILISETG